MPFVKKENAFRRNENLWRFVRFKEGTILPDLEKVTCEFSGWVYSICINEFKFGHQSFFIDIIKFFNIDTNNFTSSRVNVGIFDRLRNKLIFLVK